jgi:Ca2+-binding EF-hand superfamily protein
LYRYSEALTVYTRKFQLIEADGYTYNFMEEHPASFPRSDFDQVINRVKALGGGKEDSLRTAFIEMDVDGSGYLNEAELEAALSKVGGVQLLHPVVTHSA